MSDKITETAPAMIWLQVSPDEYPGDRDDEFPHQEEVTWCAEQIGGLEIEYVRADLVRAALPMNADDDGDPELQRLAKLLRSGA